MGLLNNHGNVDWIQSNNTGMMPQKPNRNKRRMMKFKKSTNRHVHSICHRFGDEAHMIEIGYNLFDQEF